MQHSNLFFLIALVLFEFNIKKQTKTYQIFYLYYISLD